jgi:myo-inositol 2-dehydrogenase/D-chiro-inositol 1-dehydrogenase
VAVADIDDKLLGRFAKDPVKGYHDYHEMLEDPEIEAVWVCLPNFLHAKATMEALEAGKHVFCEMPLSDKLEECKKVVALSEKVGKSVVPGATFRWTPNFVKVKELMDSDEVGNPTMFYNREYIGPSVLGAQWPAGSWAWDKERSGGTTYTLSVWAIDLMRWIIGSEITRVYASIGQVVQEKYGGITPENAQVHVAFENGVTGVFERSENSPQSMEGAELRILFDDNKSIYAIDNNVTEIHQEEYDVHTWKYFATGTRVWGHQQLDRHFVTSISRGKVPKVSAYDGMKAVEVATAMVKSAETGESVRI